MLKLYRLTEDKKDYWQAWENEDGSHTMHWGELGTEGDTQNIKKSIFANAKKRVEKEIDKMIAKGFAELDEPCVLLIEYSIDGIGTTDDIDKRHRLEERMHDILGWSGLGTCDGGSIGNATMEVCTFVADFEIAKQVIQEALLDTEFENYTKIYKQAEQ